MANSILFKSQQGEHFLIELAKEIGYPGDKVKAERVLHSYLHALRDRMEVEDALALIELMPSYLQGFMVDGWQYKQQPVELQHLQDYLAQVMIEDGKAAVSDFSSEDAAKVTMRDVFRALGRHLEGGNQYEFEAAVPYALKNMWEETVLA